MSILIRGMEMPKETYAHCMLVKDINGSVQLHVCTKNSEDISEWEYYDLVPVPPHYDLIDHNALKIAVMDCDAETRIDFLKHAMDCINKAPVVIPSDMPLFEPEEGE